MPDFETVTDGLLREKRTNFPPTRQPEGCDLVSFDQNPIDGNESFGAVGVVLKKYNPWVSIDERAADESADRSSEIVGIRKGCLLQLR